MQIRLLPTLAAVLLGLAIDARADVLTTKDGRKLEGKVVSETKTAVRFKTGAGEVEIPRAQIESLVAGKTSSDVLAELEKAAKTAEDFFQAAHFAGEKGLKSQEKRLMKRTLELDPKHAGANQFFGRVLYKGEWLEPADRDARVRADEEAEMLARGLVRWQERWVTPDEKSHLEKGEEQVGGVWMSFADAQRTRGLEEHAGQWLPRAEALARNDVDAAFAVAAGGAPNVVLGPDAIVAGPQDEAALAEIQEGLARGRAWFDATFQSKPGLDLFGGRLAEFYLFESDAAYVATVPHFAALTKTVSESWAEAVQRTHGFLWWDPYPLSSARRWKRDQKDLVGHCYHHWGHLLNNRLGYDGKLLPPWFDEGIAALLEHKIHGRNDVFCRGSRKDPRPAGPSTGGGAPPKPGTKVGKGGMLARTVAPFDPKAMQDGAWLEALKAGLGQVPPFDDLASLQFDELETADIAAAMAVVAWIESRGPGALRRFHDELRKRAPAQPQRVLDSVAARFVCYDAAFKSATSLGLVEADKAWREWTASR